MRHDKRAATHTPEEAHDPVALAKKLGANRKAKRSGKKSAAVKLPAPAAFGRPSITTKPAPTDEPPLHRNHRAAMAERAKRGQR